MPYFNRFDICAAYNALENDWNSGGWLRERPSNQRRRESIGVQLHRMQYSSPYGPSSFDGLVEGGEEYENAAEIYIDALVRLGLARLVSPDDAIATYVKRIYIPAWIREHFPQV